jgi:hypothetical protein
MKQNRINLRVIEDVINGEMDRPGQGPYRANRAASFVATRDMPDFSGKYSRGQ